MIVVGTQFMFMLIRRQTGREHQGFSAFIHYLLFLETKRQSINIISTYKIIIAHKRLVEQEQD